jgi:hypothetical protein
LPIFIVASAAAFVGFKVLVTEKTELDPSRQNRKRSRFTAFSSVVVDGEFCMTPKDFLDSVIQGPIL